LPAAGDDGGKIGVVGDDEYGGLVHDFFSMPKQL